LLQDASLHVDHRTAVGIQQHVLSRDLPETRLQDEHMVTRLAVRLAWEERFELVLRPKS
jgi:DNA recombination-dependent growth factor C